jgi:Four helix bundle sensory module for signal transduction
VPIVWLEAAAWCSVLRMRNTALRHLGYESHAIRSIAVAAIFGLGLGIPAAWADSASDVCAALANARTALYSMINAKDLSTQDALNAKVQEASTKLDSVLAGMTGADAKAADDFKAVWDQFKATRDNQIIPAIYKGNADEAKKIADGIQSERLSKMWSIMSCKVR